MGTPFKPLPVKLIAGIIFSSPDSLDKTKKACLKKFGPLDLTSPVFGFDKTDYYQEEMGQGLQRIFLSFERLIRPEDLVPAKIFTNTLEKKLSSKKSSRCVNIDPGYLSLSKLILATTKSFVHRFYAGRGIFEEITLYFKGDTFQPGPWTYPDYKTPSHIAVFNEIRDNYYRQLITTYGACALHRCV